MTPQQKLTAAYNEFIADFVERHGECQATRDEAHERAAWCVSLGQAVADMAKKFKLSESSIEWLTDAIEEIEPEEAYLVACAVAVAIEEAK